MNEKQLILFCHLGTLLGFLIAFGNFIVPLVIWLSKRDESPLVAEHAKESLNFQISMAIYGFIALIFAFILIGIPVLIAIGFTNFICVILASVKADQSEFFRYPFTIRFIS